MRNKTSIAIVAFGLMLTTHAFAATDDLPISGYTAGAGASSEISFPAWTSDDSYPVVLTAPGRDGHEVCALGLGSKWPGRGSDLKNVDKKRALACGKVQDGKVTLNFPVDKAMGQRYLEAMTWMDSPPSGNSAYFPHPGIGDEQGQGDGPFVFRNANNDPLTAWEVNRTDRQVHPYPKKDSFRGMK